MDLHGKYFNFSDTPIAICFASHMIFDFRAILMVFCDFIDERLISAICAKRFRSDKKNMLYLSHI